MDFNRFCKFIDISPQATGLRWARSLDCAHQGRGMPCVGDLNGKIGSPAHKCHFAKFTTPNGALLARQAGRHSPENAIYGQTLTRQKKLIRFYPPLTQGIVPSLPICSVKNRNGNGFLGKFPVSNIFKQMLTRLSGQCFFLHMTDIRSKKCFWRYKACHSPLNQSRRFFSPFHDSRQRISFFLSPWLKVSDS